LPSISLGQFETEHVAIEGDGTVEISDFEMDVANPNARIVPLDDRF
jgi:hypothetical protein